jgi:hypothetical protein
MHGARRDAPPSMAVQTDSILPLRTCAIVVDPADGVAVVKRELVPGSVVELDSGERIVLRGKVTPGHRFALRDLP